MKSLRILAFPLLALSALASPPPPAPELPIPTIVAEPIPEWQARWELARVLIAAERFEEAAVEYRAVLADQPGLTEARVEYGQLLGWQGNTEAALSTLGNIDPEALTPAAKILLADLLMGEERTSESIDLYRSVLEKNPNDATTRFKLARCLSFQKDYPAALAQFEHILQAHPGDVQVRRHYAQVLGWSRQPEKAAEAWRQSLEP